MAKYLGACILHLIARHRHSLELNLIFRLCSPLPIVSRGPPYQMLDLKLALYLPFLRVMEPGVFIAASDTIEVDFLKKSGYSNNHPQTYCLSPTMEGGQGETITALAHPSSLFIGSTHGVYVMPGQKTMGLQELKTCQEVKSLLFSRIWKTL